MSYWRTYYHIVWATKRREPLITPEVERVIFPSIVHGATEADAIIYALNGTVDHVHLAAAIPPKLAVAQLIGELKGRSSFIVRRELDLDFTWQVGYGVQTFGERQLRWIVEYIDHQKTHHAANAVRDELEACFDTNDGPPAVLPRSL